MDKMDAKAIVSLGVVVRDVKKVASNVSRLFGIPVSEPGAVGKFLGNDVNFQYKGSPTDGSVYTVAVDFGSLTIEFIQPVGDAPSIWKDFLDTKGEGICQINWKVKDSKKTIETMKANGIDLVMGGYTDGCIFNLFDATKVLGFTIESLEFPNEK